MVERDADVRPFDDQDGRTAEVLGDALAVALEMAAAREQAARVALLDEQQRLARELHDTVIQRLFAEGLRLESLATRAEADIAGALHEVVADLDDVMRDIRSAIFRLQRDRHLPVRQALADLVAAYCEPTGIVARVQVEPAVEDATPALVDEVLTVVRETVANAVRHAGAASVEVAVAVTADDALVVTVLDDGTGPGEGGGGGYGLANLRTRALQAGGTFALAEAPGGGTVATWRVPWARRPQHAGPVQ